jgi:hypothetical protein
MGFQAREIITRSRDPISRNTLYRERKVLVELFIDAQFVPVSKFELTEVNSVKVSSAGSTAVMPGVISAVLQPWYFQPVIVEIAGRSNIGAFSDRRLNVGSDYDVGYLIDFRDKINNYFLQARGSVSGSVADPSRGIRVKLSIGDSKNKGQIPSTGITQDFLELVGFIDDISFDESVDAPYIMSYSIKFTGEYASRFNSNRGEESAWLDASTAVSGSETASIGTKKSTTSVKKTDPAVQVEEKKKEVVETQQSVKAVDENAASENVRTNNPKILNRFLTRQRPGTTARIP